MPIPPANSSKNLVTSLAWCFIALSGFGVFVGAVQSLVLSVVSDDPNFTAAFTDPRLAPSFPPYFKFVLAHWRLFAAVFTVASAVTLVASIGLLKRRDWARRMFVVLLALGIVWSLANIVVQVATFSPAALPPQLAAGMPDLKFIWIGGMIVGALWSIGLCCLFGWLIKRLLAPDIAAEFRR